MSDWHPTLAELGFAILLVVLPWGFSKEVPVIWRLLLWSFAWSIGLHLAFTNIPLLVGRPIAVKVLIGIGVTCFAVASLWSWTYSTWIEEQSSVTTGELHAREKWTVTPPYPVFQIGIGPGNRAVMTWKGDQNTAPIQFFRKDDAVTLGIGDGEFEISTVVRDRNGNKVVEITSNRWTVYPQFSADKNYTSDTLEVQDSRGIVVLHVRVTPEKVEVEGEWNSEVWKGRRALADEKGGADFLLWNNQAKAEEYAPFTLKPIFKYPSRDFWGQYK